MEEVLFFSTGHVEHPPTHPSPTQHPHHHVFAYRVSSQFFSFGARMHVTLYSRTDFWMRTKRTLYIRNGERDLTSQTQKNHIPNSRITGPSLSRNTFLFSFSPDDYTRDVIRPSIPGPILLLLWLSRDSGNPSLLSFPLKPYKKDNSHCRNSLNWESVIQ